MIANPPRKTYPCVSVDLETLCTCPRSVILSAAVTPFDKYSGEIGPTSVWHAKAWRQVLGFRRRKVSLDTMKWWLDQSPEAREASERGQKYAMSPKGFGRALTLWFNYYTNPEKVLVYGNGAAFDNAILSDFFKNTIKMELPWRFWNDRDLRTVVGDYDEVVGGNLKKETTFTGVRHDPATDSRHQAKLCIEAYKPFSVAGNPDTTNTGDNLENDD